jgi:hypothetical protein
MDFSTIYRMNFIDKIDGGTRVDEALKGLSVKEYEEDPNARLFMMTGSSSFLSYLINSLIFQTGIAAYGRCEMFLCLPPPLMVVSEISS